MNPKTLLRSYFLAESFPLERRWSVGMTRVFTWCAIAGFAVQGTAALAILHRADIALLSILSIVVMLAAIRLNDMGKSKLARIIRMITAIAFFSVMIANSGGLTSPCFYWAGVFILGSMFSFGSASALPVTLALSGLAGYFYLQSFNHFYFFEFLSATVFVYLLSYLFDRLSKYFIQQAEIQKAKAQAARTLAENLRKNTKSIMESINVGILSILPSGIIDDLESPYFKSLSGQSDFAGHSIKDILLDRLSASSDAKDQCWQTILATIGEDRINFEANEGLFIQESSYLSGPLRRELRLKWSPLLQDNLVSKITLVVEDITEERKKALELDAKNRELAIIGQLVDISPEKCQTFFITSTRLLTENGRLLEKENITHNDIRFIFVNAHTIKGAARTLGFKELSPIIHEAEDYYQRILRQGEKIELVKLKAEHEAILNGLDLYSQVNFDKLKRNRSEEKQHLSIQRNFIEEHYHVIFNAISSVQKQTWTIEDFVDLIRNQNRELATHIFELLPNVFESYIDLSHRVANSLKKQPPKFTCDLPELIVFPELKHLLDNCMTHIIRNSLDHGLESSEERLQAGKLETGNIYIQATESLDQLRIVIRDDGRGLAIDKLRQKAAKYGIPPTAPMQEIAELIFQSGLSTAESISEISGRGVGMDGVKHYITEAGGSIEIELLGPSEPGYQYFSIVLNIPYKMPKQFNKLELVRPMNKSA